MIFLKNYFTMKLKKGEGDGNEMNFVFFQLFNHYLKIWVNMFIKHIILSIISYYRKCLYEIFSSKLFYYEAKKEAGAKNELLFIYFFSRSVLILKLEVHILLN